MKTTLYHPQAEIMEKVTRFLFFFQLAFVCFVLPVLFMVGVRGNDQSNHSNPPATEQIYQVPQGGQALVDFRSILSDKQS